MLTPQQIEDEIFFWLGQQEKEHMLFMMQGLQDIPLQHEAARLFRLYEDADKKRSAPALLGLVGASQALKQAAFQASSERWIGWLMPLFYEHMIQEIAYAMARIKRDVLPRDVTSFWAKERSDASILTAKGLDPTETKLSLQAMRNHALLRDLSVASRRMSHGNLAANVFQATTMLNGLLDSAELAKAKKIVHPLLIQHEVREGKKAEVVLQSLMHTQPQG